MKLNNEFTFPDPSLQLLLSYKDDQEFRANLDYVLLFSFYYTDKFDFFFLLHNLYIHSLYFMSSFELNAILLISSVKTVCVSL